MSMSHSEAAASNSPHFNDPSRQSAPPFQPRLMLLELVKNVWPRPTIQQTLMVTHALRGLVLSRFDSDSPPPEWVSGHRSGPQANKTDRPHLAFLALPQLEGGGREARIDAVALAVPRLVVGCSLEGGNPEIPKPPSLLIFSDLLPSTRYGPRNRSKPTPRLTLGRTGAWDLRPCPTRSSERFGEPLAQTTWVGPAETWVSVTPVALDQHPKKGKLSIEAIVAQSCTRMGYPEPIQVEFRPDSYFQGVPPALAFPPLPGRSGRPSEMRWHVAVRFAYPVDGPLLIGAGRYFGYGLMRPWRG